MLLYPLSDFLHSGLDSCGNGCNNKGDNQRGPEIQVPVIHKTKCLCYDDHKGGGYGGEAGGNNAGLFFGIKAFLVYTVCNQQSHGVASHEGATASTAERPGVFQIGLITGFINTPINSMSP